MELEDGDYKLEKTPSPKVKTEELRTPTRHDGKVIPFPLIPAAIGNLALLKQAAQDLVVHLEVVRARINQLEEAERGRNNTRNPWDFVSTDGA
ncbi:hypothetical protein BJX64DRAFT_247428 [Aspergillus heterothallicus]